MPNDEPDPAAQRLVLNYYRDLDEHRLDDALAIFHEDAVYERAGSARLEGRASIESFYREVRPPGGRHGVETVLSNKDTVGVEGWFEPASGDRVDFADVFHFDGTQVRHRRTYSLG